MADPSPEVVAAALVTDETPNGHVIFVFGDDGRTSCTSYWQDPCWDTPRNRQHTYDFIMRHEQAESVAEQELRETASELERVRARLDEATGLLGDGLTWLENWPEPGTAGLVRSYEAFLSRAPAQPYATDMSLPTCPECLLDVPLSKASTESIKAELATRAAKTEHTNGCAWYVGGPCTRGCEPAAPEPSAEIRDKLQRFCGLHIVTEADRKVLEAMDAIPDGTLRWFCELQMIVISTSLTDALKAELARRGGTHS